MTLEEKIVHNGDGTYSKVVSTSGGPGGGAVYLPAGTDRSGTITAGGVAQTLALANASRLSLAGQNTSVGDLWINEIGGTAAVDGTGSYRVGPNVTFSVKTNRAVSIIGATTGQKFAATET